RERRTLADLSQHVYTGRKISGELLEDVTQGPITLPGQRPVRALSKLDVIVDVDQTTSQAVGKVARDEEREIADLAKPVPLPTSRSLECQLEANAQRFVGGHRRPIELYKTCQQVYQIERGEVVNGESLMVHRRFHQFFEVLRWRLVSKTH